MEHAVSPAECALAVALPLTRDEFVDDATAANKDFARSVVEGSGRSATAAWTELYAPKVVALHARLANHARALGVTVACRVTAAALCELLEQFPVVSLFAHSVASPMRPTDVIEPRAVLEAIRAGGTLLARRLRDAFAARCWAGDDVALQHQIAAALDEALAPTRAWSESLTRADQRGRPAHTLNRVMLEDCFGAAIRRAPLLELHDGVHTMDGLLRAIPASFSGVLDLSVCNSVALGESIKRQRRNCLVVENVFLARVDLRLVRYALVLNRLATAPTRFTDALTEISKDLIEART